MHKHAARSLTFTVICSIFLLLTACESNDKTASTTTNFDPNNPGSYPLELTLGNVQVHFPPQSVSTQDETIIVRGIVEDTTNVDRITINGSAVSTSDGFVTWQASIPLNWGLNSLIVHSVDTAGESTEIMSLAVARETPLLSPKLMAADEANSRLLIWDNQLKALIAIDLNNSLKTILSPTSINADSLMEKPDSLELDAGGNRALLSQVSSPTVVAIDLTTGEQTEITIADDPLLAEQNLQLAMNIDANAAYISDIETVYLDSELNRVHTETTVRFDHGIIFQVDLDSGEKTTISGFNLANTDNVLESVTHIASTFDSGFLYVIDRVESEDEVTYRMFGINKVTGDRTQIELLNTSDEAYTFVAPASLELDNTSQKLFLLDNNQIISIDLKTNIYSVLSSSVIPEDSEYLLDKASAMSLINNKLYVVDDAFDYVLSINTETGLKTQIAGTGPQNTDGLQGFVSPKSVSFDIKNNLTYNLDFGDSRLASIDLSDSSKTVLVTESSELINTSLISPTSSLFNQTTKELLIVDSYQITGLQPRLLSFNTTTSEMAYLGSLAIAYQDMAIHEASQVVYVARFNSIQKVDFSEETPVFSAFSAAGVPNTEYPFSSITALAVDYTHNRLLVADKSQNAIIAVSLVNGERSQFSNFGYPINGGPKLEQPNSIVIDENRNRALVLDSVLNAVIAIDLETGQREIVVENNSESYNRLYNPKDMDFHPIFNYLVLVDNTSNMLMAIDLVNDQKVMISR